MGTAVAGWGRTFRLVDAARHAWAVLDPGDPARDVLAALIESDPPGLERAIDMIGPIFGHLERWPAADPPPPRGAARARGPQVTHLLGDPEAIRWLAATSALQALELGPVSAVGRAVAAGAVALWRGDPEGFAWLATAVRLSRADPG